MQKFIQSMHINVLGQDKNETLNSLLIPALAAVLQRFSLNCFSYKIKIKVICVSFYLI